MWPLDPLPPPPVPQRLREILKDYPELIQTLQEDLNSVITDPIRGTPPFELAIWRLEDALSAFIDQSRRELDAVKAGGDPEAIEQAEKKVRLMLGARSSGNGMQLSLMDDLWNYFQREKGASKGERGRP